MRRVVPVFLFVVVTVAGIFLWERQDFLAHAAARGDVTILRGLLALGADPNSTATGSHPLHYAVWHGRVEAAACLLAHGAKVNATEDSGVTPLITAASKGDDAMVRLLLGLGADPSARASCGTALEAARANHHDATAALLTR